MTRVMPGTSKLEYGLVPQDCNFWYLMTLGTCKGSCVFVPRQRKLYVSSSEEVVQIYVENCATYGQHCVDCVLARDPYCGWNKTHCVSATRYVVISPLL